MKIVAKYKISEVDLLWGSKIYPELTIRYQIKGTLRLVTLRHNLFDELDWDIEGQIKKMNIVKDNILPKIKDIVISKIKEDIKQSNMSIEQNRLYEEVCCGWNKFEFEI